MRSLPELLRRLPLGLRFFAVYFTVIWTLFLSAFWLLAESVPRSRRDHSPLGIFTLHTGLGSPRTARLLRQGDDHGFFGQGETYLVPQVDRETLDQWMARPSPWSGKWERGPINQEAWVLASFGTDQPVWQAGPNLPWETGTKERSHILGSNQVWYVVEIRLTGGAIGWKPSITWKRGDLLVIDRELGLVWFASFKL